MKHPYDDNPVHMAAQVTMMTLLGTNNYFSVAVKPENEGDEPKQLRIVNFHLEPLEELVKARAVWWPIQVMEIAPGVGIVHDPRIPREKYEARYCTVCCPKHLLPGPQRAGQLRNIQAGFRREGKPSESGFAVTSLNLRSLPRRTVFCWGKAPDNFLYHMNLVTDDDFEVAYWRADGPFDPENRPPSTEAITYSAGEVGDDYRDAIRRAEKEHGGHTLSVDDPDPTMYAARRRELFGDPPEVVEEPERPVRGHGCSLIPNMQQMPSKLAKAYAEKTVNPDYFSTLPQHDNVRHVEIQGTETGRTRCAEPNDCGCLADASEYDEKARNDAIRKAVAEVVEDARVGNLAVETTAYRIHAVWAHWMNYMFTQGVMNDDGTWTMPKDKVERWTRQMATDYPDLSESEKDSDRGIARKFFCLEDDGRYDLDPSQLTCTDCPDRDACEFVDDPYNTDGDCLKDK